MRSPPESSETLCKLLAGRLGDDLDAAFQGIVLVDEQEIGAPAAEKLGKHHLKIFANLGEGVGEKLLRGPIDFQDYGMELGLGIDQIGVLLLEENLTLFELVVFLNGVEIDRTHRLDALRQISHDFLDLFPAKQFGGVIDQARSSPQWKVPAETPGMRDPRSPPPEHRELFSCYVPVTR